MAVSVLRTRYAEARNGAGNAPFRIWLTGRKLSHHT